MALSHKVITNQRIYTVVEDLTLVLDALVAGLVRYELLRDEDLKEQRIASFEVLVEDPRIAALTRTVTKENGLYCLAGDAKHVFPDLENTIYKIKLKLQVPGTCEEIIEVEVNPGDSLPVMANTVQLQTNPIRIQGRVTRLDGSKILEVSGASVRVVGGSNPSTAPAGQPIALRTPVRSALHAAGTPVRSCQLTPTGQFRQLTDPAKAGSLFLRLDNLGGLSTGNVLVVGPANLGEYCRIESVDTPAWQEGRVGLRFPLSRDFPVGEEAQQVIPNPALPGTTLSREAVQGDQFLFLTNLLDGEAVAIGDPPEVEYHAVGALTDANGFYHLDGIKRVRILHLEARKNGQATLEPLRWVVDYERRINVVNLRIS